MVDLPEIVPETNLEDVQSIDVDLRSLEAKYIAPIEIVRSFSAPQTLSRNPESRRLDNNIDKTNRNELDRMHVEREPQESRAHAFYRIIGLPVMADDTISFYNPGFTPTVLKKSQEERDSVARRVPQTIRLMHQFREDSARARANVFKSSSSSASIFATVMNILRPFQVIDTNKTFLQQDNQIISVPERKQKILNKYLKFNGEEFQTQTQADGDQVILPDNFFESVSHIIRPLTVDPIIERTVVGENRLIAAPFLLKPEDTKVSQDIPLKRPAIEQILRLRLQENPDGDFLGDVIFTLDTSFDEFENLSESDARRIANALLAENSVVESVNVSSLEAQRLNDLIRTIKALVDKLVESVENISDIEQKISWTPLPPERGPIAIRGFELANFIKRKRRISKLEQQITNLRIKEVVAKNLPSLGTNVIGDDDVFALSSFQTNRKTFESELNAAIQERNEFIRSGAESLRAIELITGEVSGLGLIDILAIYTALWAIDLDTLLSLLDDESFERLIETSKNDSAINLINPNVESRQISGPVFSVFEALQRFEAQVISILAFADKLIERKRAVSKESEGGSVVASGE